MFPLLPKSYGISGRSLHTSTKMNIAGLELNILLERLPELAILATTLFLIFFTANQARKSNEINKTILIIIIMVGISLVGGLLIGYNEGTKLALNEAVHTWCNEDENRLNACSEVCRVFDEYTVSRKTFSQPF